MYNKLILDGFQRASVVRLSWSLIITRKLEGEVKQERSSQKEVINKAKKTKVRAK
jgi:hypothetical protein